MPDIKPSTCNVNCCPNRFLYMMSGLYGPAGPARKPGASVNEPLNRAGIRERRYRRSGNPAQGLPTVPDSGEKKPFLPHSARERASVGTDGRRFERRAAPALPTVPVSRAARRPFYRLSRIPARGLVSPTRTSGQRLPGARRDRPAPSFAWPRSRAPW